MTKIIAVSDTHGRHDAIKVPDGDVLIHAGDFSEEGNLARVDSFNDWLADLPHEHKIFVPGNHDFCFETEHHQREAIGRLSAAEVLIDDFLEVNGLKIWGTPWQPEFMDWAFNLERGKALREKWNQIPSDVDVLVTHCPPYGIGDHVSRNDLRVGCQELQKALNRIEPDLHVFGHIHEGYGTYNRNGTVFLNASICDYGYHPSNDPIVRKVSV